MRVLVNAAALSPYLVILVLAALLGSANGNEALCGLSGGTMDENGDCILCLGAENCCILDLTTFGMTCDPFCLALDGGGAHCGTTTCQGSPSGASCATSVDVDGAAVTLQFTCDSTLVCDCSTSTWNGEECAACEGLAGGFDCSNVEGGRCWNAGTCAGEEVAKTAPPSPSPPEPLDRPYRTDAGFRAEAERMAMPAASAAAGVPIGGAVPDYSEDSMAMLKKHVPSQYNMVVAENDMKWNRLIANEDILGEYNFTAADVMVDYAKSVGATVRGHVLIWGRSKGTTYPTAVAAEVEASTNPEATLLGIMQDHIEAVGTHFGDKVDAWDVVNEHLTSRFDDNIFYKTFGDAYVKFSFEIARKVLPNTTRLVWNEALTKFSLSDPTISWWLEKLQQYKDEGVPIDGIGVQGHNIATTHNTNELAIFLKVVADMGYDVELTEVDAPITVFLDDETSADPFEAQGDFFKQYSLACLDSGRCKGITFWGLDDSSTWYDWLYPQTAPNLPVLIDEDGYEKPAWLSVRDALYESSDVGGNATGTPTQSPVEGGEPSASSTSSPSGAAVVQHTSFGLVAALLLVSFSMR